MLARLLRLAVDVKDGEIAGLVASFLLHFSLLSGYFILRPLRDEMGIAGDPGKLPWMFTVTFVVVLCVVPIYSALAARIGKRMLVALIYRFLIVNLVAFFLVWRSGFEQVWVARVFFVWVTVYVVFVVSVFWSLMADTWATAQSKRLYGFIAAGGTAGSMAGSFITLALAQTVGVAPLMLTTAVLLEVAAQCARRLPSSGEHTEAPLGGGVLEGFRRVLTRPFLLGIAAMVLLYAVTSTFIYLEQAHILKARVAGAADRTSIFALQDLFVNSVLIGIQLLVTGRVLTRFGLAVAMSIVPTATAIGFALLAAAPGVLLIAAFNAIRRVLHFAFDRPSREVLFTAVPREDKYKSKSFIDNVSFRGGDVIGGALYAVAGTAAPVALPLSLAWLGVAQLLARAHERRARQGASP
jgi:AAA family ATP:ADP antiporter